MKSGNLKFPEPSGPLQACNGTALPFICLTTVEKVRKNLSKGKPTSVSYELFQEGVHKTEHVHYEDYCRLGCDAVWSGKRVPTFQAKLLSPRFTLKMETASPSETLLHFYENSRRHIPHKIIFTVTNLRRSNLTEPLSIVTWCNSPQSARAYSLSKLHDHILTHHTR